LRHFSASPHYFLACEHRIFVRSATVTCSLYIGHVIPFLAPVKFAPIVLRHGNVMSLDASRNISYDRIYVGADCCKAQLPHLLSLLAPGGVLIVPCEEELLHVTKAEGGGKDSYRKVCGVRYANLELPKRTEPKLIFESKEDAAQMNEVYARVIPIKPASTKQRTAPEPNVASEGFSVFVPHGAAVPSISRRRVTQKGSAVSPAFEDEDNEDEEEEADVMISFNVRTQRDDAANLARLLRRVGLKPWLCTECLSVGAHWRYV
jgi:hypothetical protein